MADSLPAIAETSSVLTSRKGLWGFALAAVLVCLGYTLFTKQVWEDTLITLRHGENLIKGEGLTYNPGTRVHGFTSPVNVLLLTSCYVITGQGNYETTCWAYRIFTIASFAGAGVLLLKAFERMVPRWAPATWFLAAMYLIDLRGVAFATNGMETAFMLALLAWALLLLTDTEPDRWIARGLCWGGLMWTRPDGCVYIAGLAIVELLFFRAGERKRALISLGKSAGLCGLIYLPWFLWAWVYYGSPVPHTVTAKADVEQGPWAQLLGTLDTLFQRMLSEAASVFRPLYYSEDIGDWIPSSPFWSRVLNGVTKIAGVFSLLFWLFGTDRWGRASSFFFTFLCLYFSAMTWAFPWYYPPAALLAYVTMARAGVQFAATGKPRSPEPIWNYVRVGVVSAAFIVLALGQMALFGAGSWQEMIFQKEIDAGNRAAIGAWLKEHGKPTDTVFLEPLGYIGYYSGMRMMDYPGLVSPEVVAARKGLPATNGISGLGRILVIPRLHPDWIVLRFAEVEQLRKTAGFEEFMANYHLENQFVAKELLEYAFLPGELQLGYDAAFAVFKRNTTSPALPPSP